MRFSAAAPLLMSIFAAVSLVGCVGGTNINQNTTVSSGASVADAAKTNVEELNVLLRIPYESQDAVWKEFPAQRRIVAVLRFAPVDADRIIAASQSSGAGQPVSLPVESWFPEELVAQGELSGDSALRGSAYSASEFAQEPYTSGRAIRIEGTDYFVVEVNAVGGN